MGYSYAAAAGYTLDAIGKLINVKCSNGMPDGGFYEYGREQRDGAITGTVYAPMPDGKHCRKRGSFRVNPDGTVARFPGLSRELIAKAVAMGAAEYQRIHCPRKTDWRADARRLIAFLRDEPQLAMECWNDYQAIHRQWQTEARIMFAVMPNATAPAMIADLESMLELETA